MKKMVNKLLTALAVFAAGGAAVGAISKKRADAANEALKKSHKLYMVFDQWVTFLEKGGPLEEYFKQNNYKTVAIYGMREFGEHLYNELKDSDITVKYAIDKNIDAIYTEGVDLVTPDGYLEKVDVIVVTAVYYFEEIKEELGRKVDYAIISLEDIINMEQNTSGLLYEEPWLRISGAKVFLYTVLQNWHDKKTSAASERLYCPTGQAAVLPYMVTGDTTGVSPSHTSSIC